MLRRLDLHVNYEPALSSTSKRPDFFVNGVHPFLLEVRTVGPSAERQRSDSRRQVAIEPLRNLQSDRFTIDVGIVRESNAAPPVRRIIPTVEKWLANLDREQIDRLASEGLSRVPTLNIPCGDWEFRIRPIPKPETQVGVRSASGSVSIFPGRGGDWGRIENALKGKARRYGQLDKAFVIALSIGDLFVDEEEIVSALWGRPGFSVAATGRVSIGRSGGLWGSGANSRVLAVLTVRHLTRNAVNKAVPILWRNESARHPLVADFPITAEGRLSPSGEIVIGDAATSPAAFFDLPAEWPGPERPWRVRQS